jgi:DNA-binding NarL/FixJ family response regulator
VGQEELRREMLEQRGGLVERNGNGSRSREAASIRPSFLELRAESRRLQFEFLRNTIDLALTMAGLSDVRPQSETLRSASARMAHKSYRNILSMWERTASTGTNIAELNPKLQLLRQALQGNTNGVTVNLVAKVEVSQATPPQVFREILTAREMEVLRLIATGHSTKETAHLLGMSFKTAACHRYRLMDKLAIHDTASLVRYAIREKLVEP